MRGERFPTDLRPAVIAYAEKNLIRLADMGLAPAQARDRWGTQG